MTSKNLLIYFNIFILTLTITFSNISANFVFAETENETIEQTTETTTEAPSIISNFCEPDKQLDIKARAAILVDYDTGVVLYEKNADEVLYPASITKVMTALLGCEYGKFDETVKHSENAINGIGYGSSTMGMLVGEEISLEDCLYGIMMCSANEACMALAEHISGNVDNFVDEMNKRAEDLGCTNTHFANPHGFHDDNHYTTARDMSLIVREAVKNEKFSEIWGTMVRTLPPTNLVNEPRGLVSKAKILDDESQYYYPYIKGAKTGFHDEAKNTLVSCAEKDGIKLISVVMKNDGAALCYSDTKTLFDYGFTQYETKTIYDGSEYADTISVVQTYNTREYPMGSVNVTVNGSVEKLVPKPLDINKITSEPVIEEKLETPVVAGDSVGKMKLIYEGIDFGELDIVAEASVDRLDDREMAKKELIINIKHFGVIALKYFGIFLLVIIVIIILIRLIRAIIKPKRKKKRRKKKYNKNKAASNRYKNTSQHKKKRRKKRRPAPDAGRNNI